MDNDYRPVRSDIGELANAEENAFRDYLQTHATYEDAPQDRYTRAVFPAHVQGDARARWQGLYDVLIAFALDRTSIILDDTVVAANEEA